MSSYSTDIMMDMDLNIQGCGKKLGRLFPQLMTTSTEALLNLEEVFKVRTLNHDS
jgi:hypothetical protein